MRKIKDTLFSIVAMLIAIAMMTGLVAYMLTLIKIMSQDNT